MESDLFFPSFSDYFSSVRSVPGTVPGTGHTAVQGRAGPHPDSPTMGAVVGLLVVSVPCVFTPAESGDCDCQMAMLKDTKDTLCSRT